MTGFLAVHLGAGYHSSQLKSEYKRLCSQALNEGKSALAQNEDSLSVIVKMTKTLENSPLTNAGFGSNLSFSGKVECDASVMEGKTMNTGCVGALSGVSNPILVADSLARAQNERLSLGRVPPCVLTGAGALAWARKKGIPTVDPTAMISNEAERQHKKYLRRVQRDAEETEIEQRSVAVNERLDTVGGVAVDRTGTASSSCSSGGILLKMEGRLGQAAVPGGGCWAQDGLAISLSGTGEELLKTSLCRRIADSLLNHENNEPLLSVLVRTINVQFLQSKLLDSNCTRLCGVLLLKTTSDDGGELLWAHTTQTMAFAYSHPSQSSINFQISKLPEGLAPGTKVIGGGTSWP